MSRWAPDAAVRLERAALELFAEQGYTATTVPQITARAGLTTRTFFRHFADKREVLFLAETQFPTTVSALLAAAPESLAPVDLVIHGFAAVAADADDRLRHDLAVRRTVIRSDERLRERELLKSATLSMAIEQALLDYGVPRSDATLLAPLSVLIFDLAVADWLDEPAERSLLEVLDHTWTRMQWLSTAPSSGPVTTG